MANEQEFVHRFWVGVTAEGEAEFQFGTDGIDRKCFEFLTKLFELTKEIYPEKVQEVDHLDEWLESVKGMTCGNCGGPMQAVRPGKIQCPDCG